MFRSLNNCNNKIFFQKIAYVVIRRKIRPLSQTFIATQNKNYDDASRSRMWKFVMRLLNQNELTTVSAGDLTTLAVEAICGCAIGAIASFFINAPRLNVILSSTVLIVGFYELTADN